MQKLKTRVVKKNINPEWNEDLTLSIADPSVPIKLVSVIVLVTLEAYTSIIKRTTRIIMLYIFVGIKENEVALITEKLSQIFYQPNTFFFFK